MKLCIPVEEVKGIYSRVSPHFGSAEAYLLIDTESLEINSFRKEGSQHEQGRCGPVRLLRGKGVEGVVATGIGRNALARLQEMGATVYSSEAKTVAEVLLQLRDDRLGEMTLEQACQHHAEHGGKGRHRV